MGQALQMDQLGIATGQQPVIDLQSAIQETLTQGGWTDVDFLFNDVQPQDAAAGSLEALPAAIAGLQGIDNAGTVV